MITNRSASDSSIPPVRGRPIFGLNITPNTDLEKHYLLAKTAEELGLDLIGIQDHPYNGSYFDTWSLISALSMSTKRIRYFADVSDLPMRPPAMLAKASSTLDIITKGRLELGIGAGAYWDAIHAYGGQRRSPPEAVEAFEEALQIIRLLWDYGHEGRRRATFKGKYYQLDNAQTGPRPYHDIRIWVGAIGPRMLRVIGRVADEWVIPINTNISTSDIKTGQEIINATLKENGRSPTAISRISNLVGIIDEEGKFDKSPGEKALFVGSISDWVEKVNSLYHELGVNTFVFWPTAQGQEENQLRLFAERVVPKVNDSA
ncbi:MAG: LLM class flavin-dependent oxidoreductase [Nitrososphaerales archaeon]